MRNRLITMDELFDATVHMLRALPPPETVYRRYMREIRDEDRDRASRDLLARRFGASVVEVPPWFGPVTR